MIKSYISVFSILQYLFVKKGRYLSKKLEEDIIRKYNIIVKNITIYFDNMEWNCQTFISKADPTKQPMIVLHGIYSSAIEWHRLFNKFECDVYFIDIPGFGRCDIKSNRKVVFEDYAKFLSLYLDEMGIKKTNILAYSFGAYIAAFFAKMHPCRIHRIIFAAPSCLFPIIGPNGFYVGLFFKFRILYYIMRYFGIIFMLIRGLNTDCYNIGNSYRSIQLFSSCITVSYNPPSVYINKPIFNYVMGIPTSFIWGKYDNLIPFKHGEVLKKICPNVNSYLIDSDHSIHKNSKFVNIVKKCLKSACILKSNKQIDDLLAKKTGVRAYPLYSRSIDSANKFYNSITN